MRLLTTCRTGHSTASARRFFSCGTSALRVIPVRWKGSSQWAASAFAVARCAGVVFAASHGSPGHAGHAFNPVQHGLEVGGSNREDSPAQAGSVMHEGSASVDSVAASRAESARARANCIGARAA